MISAYDTLGCLPNSDLQYCTWHALDAMVGWYRKAGKYIKDQIDVLKAHSHAYIYSRTLEAVELNRKQLTDLLLPDDRHYILETWKARERRFVAYYTKKLTNLGQTATSRVEGFNAKVHRHTNHQMGLQKAANKLISFVDDSWRGFFDDNDIARVERGIGIDRHFFQTPQGIITLPAIALINQQWQLLITNPQGKCTNQFRKQHLLPCAHNLQTTWSMGIPIPKSLVHPRWWLDGHILKDREWKPTYEPVQVVLLQLPHQQ